jgi:hypothetical protein
VPHVITVYQGPAAAESEEAVSDTLTLTADGPDRLGFELFPITTNAYTCALSGTAFRAGRGFECLERSEGEARPCRLRFTADRTAIPVEELDDGCRWYCGARATIGRVLFLRPTCPPVRDQ